jgi:AcrR family transcriptional regulator
MFSGGILVQQRSEETRNRILAAAVDLFALKGYDGTGVADICSAANVSKGAFYHHFQTKQAVFQALLADWLDQLDGELKKNLAASSDVPSGLLSMAGQTGKIFEGAQSHGLIYIEFWMQASRQPEIWKTVVEPYLRYVETFSTIFTKGVAEGSLDPSIDPRTSARLVIALSLGMLLQAIFDPSGEKWEAVTQDGIRIFINGISRRPS